MQHNKQKKRSVKICTLYLQIITAILPIIYATVVFKEYNVEQGSAKWATSSPWGRKQQKGTMRP